MTKRFRWLYFFSPCFGRTAILNNNRLIVTVFRTKKKKKRRSKRWFVDFPSTSLFHQLGFLRFFIIIPIEVWDIKFWAINFTVLSFSHIIFLLLNSWGKKKEKLSDLRTTRCVKKCEETKTCSIKNRFYQRKLLSTTIFR